MKDEVSQLCQFNRVFFYEPLLAEELIEAVGSIEKIFELKPSAIDSLIGKEGYGEKLHSPKNQLHSAEDAAWYKAHKVEVVSRESENYPFLLAECPDAPPVFFYRGNFPLHSLCKNPPEYRSLAVVGTRMCSRYGEYSCRNIIQALSEKRLNMLIISGLAKGIDITSHRAALDNGFPTIAVLPCGIDRVYPPCNRAAAVKIVENGGVLTEFPRGIEPKRPHFLQRNRIIAGLSEAVLVVESRLKGGAINTACHAGGYQRDIFAIPGRLEDPNSQGCNSLISKNIAAICYNAATISKALGWEEALEDEVGIKEKLLLNLSVTKFKSIDKIVEQSGFPFEEIIAATVELEALGKIRSNSAGEYALCKKRKDDAIY